MTGGQEKRSLHEVLRRHSVLLINREERSIGTGVLATVRGRQFVLTAAHNLHGGLGLFIMGSQSLEPSGDIWANDALDLAYIRIEAVGRGRRIDSFAIDRDDAHPPYDDRSIAICGYPSAMARFDLQGGIPSGKSFLLTTHLLEPGAWPSGIADSGKNPNDNFLLDYGSTRNSLAGSGMDPRGLSGAGVWSCEALTSREGTFRYKLFGIQTGVYRNEGMLVGSFIRPLIGQIESNPKLHP